MFVFLSKFLPIFVYPLSLGCIALIVALLLRKREKLGKFLVIFTLVILWLGGNRWVTMALARSLEWQYLPEGEIQTADAIVVLGGGTDSPEAPRPIVEMNSAGDRVVYGAHLYHEGKAPVIVLSGGSITWLGSRTSTPADEMASLMEMLGVPDEALNLQDKSQNTYEDATLSAAVLKDLGAERIILVTSAMHMPRSMGLFEKQGFEVIPAPTDFKVTEAGWKNLWEPNLEGQLVNFFPTASNLGATTNVIKEYLGMLVYRFRGWM